MTRAAAWKPTPLNENSKLDPGILQRLLDEIYGSEYQFLSDAQLKRVADTNFYYGYYDLEEQYWALPNNLGYTPTILPINLARWFVKKRASWMFEVAPDIECPPKTVDKEVDLQSPDYKPSDKQKREDKKAAAREQILYSIWSENQFDEKLLEGGRDWLIGGTCALVLRYLPYKGIRFSFKPTQEVFPVPDIDEPDKFNKIYFCSYLDNDATLWKQTWELIEGHCYLSEGTYSSRNLAPINIRYDREDTGLDFIPVVLFQHQALSGKLFGTSYLRDLIPIFDQYNKSMSDASDALRFNLFAVTVLLNAPPGAEKKLKIAPNELWNIGGDGVDAKKLESGFNYATALADFLTRLENVMHLIGEVPDVTPDRIKGFGLVSGVALKLLYSDLVSATQQAWRIWKSRLQQTDEYILRILETYEGTEGYPYDFKISDISGEYANRIIPHLPLPENEAEKINMEVNKLTNSLQSVKGALQELGEKYPERKIAEIILERESFVEDGGGYGKMLSDEEKKTLGGL